MIGHYLKLAVRNLLKYRTQNIISIVGLAVGILSFTVCFYVSRLWLDVNKCFEKYERIAILGKTNEKGRFSAYTSYEICDFVRERNITEVEACCYVTDLNGRDFIVNDEKYGPLPYTLTYLEADTSFNRVFTPEIIAGSWFAVSVSDNSVIMTESCAKRIFGSAAEAVGKTLVTTERLPFSHPGIPRNGGLFYTVQAVMSDLPQNNSLSAMRPLDIIAVNGRDGIFASHRKGLDLGYSYALLSSGNSVEEVNRTLEAVEMTGDPEGYHAELVEWSEITDKSGRLIIIVTGLLGLLVLLVGFINFFQFLIGSLLNRTKEFSVMKLYGNDRRKLFMLLFTESLLIVLCASFLTLWMVEVFGGRLDVSIDEFISVNFSKGILYRQVLEYIGIIILLCAAISYFVALRINRITVRDGIFGGEGKRGKQRGRNIMLGFQFFICWIFMIGTAALYMQARETNTQLLNSLSKKEKKEILSVSMEYSFMKYEDRMVMANRIGQHSGVKDILLADISYLDGASGDFYTDEKMEWESYAMLDGYNVPDNFFSFMNIEIEQGRELRTGTDLIVDRNWPLGRGKDVVGMTLYSDTTYTVCGICAPFHTSPYRAGRGRGHGFKYDDENVRKYVAHCYVKCHEGQQEEVKAWIEDIRKEMLPANISPEIKTLAEDIIDHQAMNYMLMKIILFFSIVSLVLTLLGVYSSVTLDTEHRQKEVAIRKVNGAGIRQIMTMFCKLYIILLAVTASAAFLIGYFLLDSVAQSFTVFFNYGPLFWIGIFLTVAAVTFLTIIFCILRIARINPAEVLKKD